MSQRSDEVQRPELNAEMSQLSTAIEPARSRATARHVTAAECLLLVLIEC